MKEALYCVYGGITKVLFIFLNRIQTLNADLYFQQRQRPHFSIEKRSTSPW